jgi:hypothetical protein
MYPYWEYVKWTLLTSVQSLGTFNVSPQPEISLRQSLRQGLSSKSRPVRTPNKAEGVGLCI